MSDYTVNVKYAVDSSGLKNAANEAEKLSRKLKETAGNAAPIGKGLEESLGKIKGVSGLATGGIEGLESAILGATSAAAGLAAGVVVVVGALAALSFNNLKSIHEINEIAEVSGVAAERLAQMAAVAAREGISVEDFGVIINKTAKAVTEAVESNSQLAKTFTDLGLSTRDLQKLSPDEKFLKIFDAIQKVNEQGKKFEAVTQIFGKSAVEILKVASSAEDFKNRMAEAATTGEAASQNLLDKAAEQDKQLKELAAKWVEVKNKITEVFAPVIIAGLNTLVGLIDGQAGAWDRVLRVVNPVYAIYRAMGGKNPFNWLLHDGSTTAAPYNQRPGAVPMSGYITGREPGTAANPTTPTSTDNTTDAERAAAASKAKAAADAAASKAAAEAKRVQEAYNSELKKTVTLVRELQDGAATDSMSRAVNETAPALVDQFNAALSTAKQAGLEVTGWNESLDHSHIILSTKVGPALEEIAAKAGKTTEELKKQADIAVTTAEAREHESQVAERHAEIVKTTTDYTAKAAIDAAAIAEINAGRITTEAELSQYLEDQAFYAEMALKAKNGATDADIAALQAAHDLAEGQGKALDATKQKAFDALDESKNFYNTFTNGFVDTFVDGLARGKIEWKKWLADLANQLLKSYLLKLLQTYLPMIGGTQVNGSADLGGTTYGTSNTYPGGTASALGNVFSNGNLMRFANGGAFTNSIATSPTIAPMALFGEKGPEAIMPLTRGANGKLGVAAHGGLGTQVINLGNTTINVQSTSDTARDDRETAKAIDKMLEDKMNRWLREQRRSGNQLNPNFGYSY